MAKLRPDGERSYFRFPISLLSLVSGADLRPDSDPDSDGRRLGLCIIAHTLFEKGRAQLLRLGEEYIEHSGQAEATAERYGTDFGFMAADWLQQHKPGTLPEELMVDVWQRMTRDRAAVALAPGRNFADANSPNPLPDNVSEGGRLGGLGIKAGPLPDFHVLQSTYWDAGAHVETVAEITGGRSMDATVRADFVRELAAGRMPLREFRILAAITAKLSGDRPFTQTTDDHLAVLASGYRSHDAFEAWCADFDQTEARELAFRESDEFKAWPEEERIAALASAAEFDAVPRPRILFTVNQVAYTRKQLCAPRGVFVGYLYNRRRLYLAHPARLAKHAREKGDDPALTLARLVEEQYGRGDERKHAAHAAAAIAKAERAAAAVARDRDLAEHLRRIAASAGAPPSSVESPRTSRESPGSVPPYTEAPSDKQQQEKQQQHKHQRTADGDAAARARGESRKRMTEDREPVAQAPLSPSPAVPSTPEPNPSASAALTFEGYDDGEADPTPEPDPPGVGIPAAVPVPEAAVPVPITNAFRPQEGAARAAHGVAEPPTANPEHPPAGALWSAEAFARWQASGDPGPVYGPGGMFKQIVTASGRACYAERPKWEVSVERAQIEAAEWRRDSSTG